MRAPGMQLETFDGATPPVRRQALRCGRRKIELHVHGAEFEPKAQPVQGTPNLCCIASVTLDAVVQQ